MFGGFECELLILLLHVNVGDHWLVDVQVGDDNHGILVRLPSPAERLVDSLAALLRDLHHHFIVNNEIAKADSLRSSYTAKEDRLTPSLNLRRPELHGRPAQVK